MPNSAISHRFFLYSEVIRTTNVSHPIHSLTTNSINLETYSHLSSLPWNPAYFSTSVSFLTFHPQPIYINKCIHSNSSILKNKTCITFRGRGGTARQSSLWQLTSRTETIRTTSASSLTMKNFIITVFNKLSQDSLIISPFFFTRIQEDREIHIYFPSPPRNRRLSFTKVAMTGKKCQPKTSHYTALINGRMGCSGGNFICSEIHLQVSRINSDQIMKNDFTNVGLLDG